MKAGHAAARSGARRAVLIGLGLIAFYLLISLIAQDFQSLRAFSRMLLGIGVLAVLAWIVPPNADFLWRVAVRTLSSRTVGPAANRARNGIYVLTFSVLLLRKHDALDGLAAVLPLPLVGTPDLLAEAVALLLGFLWLAFLVHRVIEETDFALSDEPLTAEYSDFEPIMITRVAVFLLTALLNVGAPLILTLAVLGSLEVSPSVTLFEFISFVWAEVLALLDGFFPPVAPGSPEG